MFLMDQTTASITAKTYLVSEHLKSRELKDENWQNTSLAAPGALTNRLQRRTARKANEANLEFPNLKTEITSLH